MGIAFVRLSTSLHAHEVWWGRRLGEKRKEKSSRYKREREATNTELACKIIGIQTAHTYVCTKHAVHNHKKYTIFGLVS